MFLADSRRGRLLRGTLTRHGRLRLEETARIELSVPEPEHDRPSARAGRSGHSNASRSHDDEEAMHRFARQVVEFLSARLDSTSRRIALIAPDRMVGAVRKVLPPQVGDRLDVHRGEFAHLSEPELRSTPIVRRLCGG